MRPPPDFRYFAYGVIVLGTALSFVAAVVPHYTAGHTLRVGVLVAGVLPYLVIGALSHTVRGWLLMICSALLLAVDLLVKLSLRFLDYDGYADGLVYSVPVIAALVLAIVLGIAARRPPPQPANAPPAPPPADETQSTAG